MEGEVEDIRRDPSALNGLGVAEIVDHYDRIVRGLGTPPVIMGHSFGGLVTELLLDRGLGAAGVALSPAPVKGVLRLPPAELRTAFPVLGNPTNKNKTVELTAKQFRWAFTNTMSDADAQAAYERYRFPAPAGCSSRRRSRTSTRAPSPRSTSTRTTARRCSWSGTTRTTPSRPR